MHSYISQSICSSFIMFSSGDEKDVEWITKFCNIGLLLTAASLSVPLRMKVLKNNP